MYGFFAICIIAILFVTMMCFFTFINRDRKKGAIRFKLGFKSKLMSGIFELYSTSQETAVIDSPSESEQDTESEQKSPVIAPPTESE